MFKNGENSAENSSKRENESQVCLEKLIKLDCRDSNFIFKDQLRKRHFKVHYPHTSTEVCPGQHLLKKFWTHLQSHYFKRPDAEQCKRLQYVKDLLGEDPLNETSYNSQEEFQSLIREVFEDSMADKLLSAEGEIPDQDNLYDRLFIVWRLFSVKTTPREAKTVRKQLKQGLEALQCQKNKKKFKLSLKKEAEVLRNLKESQILSAQKQDSTNQIQKQIYGLEQELQEIQNSNLSTLKQIEHNIESENSPRASISEQRSNSQFGRNVPRRQKSARSRGSLARQSPLPACELSLKDIEFTIRNLEERQLAESISKVLECRKFNGENRYLVSFEAAMNVEPKQMSEEQLMKLNKLRETSLFQFYRTGVKSLYSYTCQSYAGFSQLCKDRKSLRAFKPQDVMQMMKKNQTCCPQNYESFKKFSTCHHCRFLFPDYLLKTCKFASDRQVMPKSTYEVTLDPDFSEIGNIASQPEKARVSQRFTTRKKNCLTGYAKINEEYVCNRKFCFSCLKDNYPNDTMNDSMYCPFCYGRCTCSRCLRNQKIVKFRNAYSILGGEISHLNNDSCLESLQNKEESIIPRRRGRPKKLNVKKGHIVIDKAHKKMRPILGELKLAGLGLNSGKKLKSKKKTDKVHKKRLILKLKSSNLLPIKRKRGRPPKNKQLPAQSYTKPLKNQADMKQIESLFSSMSKN